MKKLLSMMVAALFAAGQATAQNTYATLVHEGTMKSYNGNKGLELAMADAEDGDVITLSAGVFDCADITKAVTLRGAGMEADEYGYRTIISNGTMYLRLDDAAEKSVTIEGIFMPNVYVYVDNILGAVTINKCVIADYSTRTYAKISVLTNCKAYYIGYYGSDLPESGSLNVYNSFVNSLYSVGGQRFDHCVVGYSGQFNGEYYNSVLLSTNNGVYGFADHSVATFAIASNYGSNNYEVDSPADVLANYDADVATSSGKFFDADLTLTDAAKALYVGSDLTEVGIYGGSLPFSPWLELPVIKRLTVAPKSTKEGTLSVDIEVSGVE